MKDEKEKLLTVKEMSKRANISPSTIYSVLHYDKLPSTTIADRIVVKESVFNDWVKTNLKEPKETKSKNEK
jgi:predicted transcriptional regulator